MDINTTPVTTKNVTRFMPLVPRQYHRALEDLERSGAVAVGAVFGGTACGALLGEVEEGVLKLRSIFVAESFRERGAGTMMLMDLVGCCCALPQITTIQADFVPEHSGDERLQRLFERVGFGADALDARQYTIRLRDVSGQAVGSIKSGGPEYVAFDQLPAPYVKEWNSYLHTEEACPMELPIQQRDLLGELSFAYVSDLRVSGAVVVQQLEEEVLRLSWIFTRPELAQSAAQVLINLIGHSLDRALKAYPDTARVEISALTAFSQTLTQKLCPGVEGRRGQRAVLDLTALRRSREAEAKPDVDAMIREYARQRAGMGGQRDVQ